MIDRISKNGIEILCSISLHLEDSLCIRSVKDLLILNFRHLGKSIESDGKKITEKLTNHTGLERILR